MCTTFLCYTWMYTSVQLVVSLEWDIHDLCVLMVSHNLRCESITFIYVHMHIMRLQSGFHVYGCPIYSNTLTLSWISCIICSSTSAHIITIVKYINTSCNQSMPYVFTYWQKLLYHRRNLLFISSIKLSYIHVNSYFSYFIK